MTCIWIVSGWRRSLRRGETEEEKGVACDSIDSCALPAALALAFRLAMLLDSAFFVYFMDKKKTVFV